MTQTIVGGSAVKPFNERLNAKPLRRINGRFVNIRAAPASQALRLNVYTKQRLRLDSQPGTLQLGRVYGFGRRTSMMYSA